MNFKYKQYGFETKQAFRNEVLMLHKSGQTQAQIQRKLGCSKLTAIKIFRHLGIKAQRQDLLHIKCGFKSDKDMADEFERLYNEGGMSQNDIARKFGVSVISVRQCFLRNQKATRKTSESIGVKQKDIKLTEQELNIINGLLLGEGRLEAKNYTATFQYASPNPELIETIANSLRRLKIKCPYKSGLYYLQTASFKSLLSLREQWYTADNWKQIPEWLEFNADTCYWWHVGNTSVLTSMLRFHMQDFRQDLRPAVKKMPAKASCYMADDGYLIIIIPFASEIKKFLEYIGPCRHLSCADKWQTSS